VLATNNDLQTCVREALKWDLEVDARHIAVSAETGAVTLSGYVPTYVAKVHAVNTAEHVFGVRAVADELEVRVQSPFANDDSTIAASIARTFVSDVTLARYNLKAKVANGHVTLIGSVERSYERDQAKQAIADIPGVQFVLNDIVVTPRATAGEVQSHITNALIRQGALDACHVHVAISGGTAVLSGQLHSLDEARVARTAAICSPGITHVETHILIER
jgi:osmotically-inducible protein OsmY